MERRRGSVVTIQTEKKKTHQRKSSFISAGGASRRTRELLKPLGLLKKKTFLYLLSRKTVIQQCAADVLAVIRVPNRHI